MGEPRMQWNDDAMKCFLLTCIEEVNERGRKRTSLYPESWARVGQVLKETLNVVVTQKQMKNCFDYLKPKYFAWLYLTKKGGNVYNPTTNSFNLSQKEWEEFYKGHPKGKTLRTSNLPYPDLCSALFDGTSPTGDNQLTPCSSHPRPRDSSSSTAPPNPQLLELDNIDNVSQDGGLQSSPPSETGTSTPNTSIPRLNGEPRMHWSDDAIKCFLLTCIEEVSKRGRKGNSLHPHSWARVGQVLKETLNVVVTRKQMKNCYDYLRPKYFAWLYLTKKAGNAYNPSTNSFTLSHKEWEEFYKGHPKGKTLRTSNLPYPDLCSALFDGTSPTGDNQLTPSSDHPRPRDSSSTTAPPNPQLFEPNDIYSESQNVGLQNSPLPSESGTSTPNTSISRSKEEERKTSNHEGDRPKKKGRCSSKVAQLEKDMSSALKLILKNNDGPTYEECLDKLNKLGWDANCSLYVAALGVFCEAPSFRKGWMSLPTHNVELMKSWVTSVATKLGYPV